MSRAEQPNFQEGALGDIRKLGTPVQEAVQVPTGEVRGKGFFDRVLRHPVREVYKLEDSQRRVLGETEVVNERLRREKARQEMKIFNSKGELQRIDTAIYDPITRKVNSFQMVDVKTGLPIKEVHREELWGGRFVVKEHFVDKIQARSVRELNLSGKEIASTNFDYVQTPTGTHVSKESTIIKREDGKTIKTKNIETIYDSDGHEAKQEKIEIDSYRVPGTTIQHTISTTVREGGRKAVYTFYSAHYVGETKERANLREEYNNSTKYKYSDSDLVEEEQIDVTRYSKDLDGRLETKKAPRQIFRRSYNKHGGLLFQDIFEEGRNVMRINYVGDKKERKKEEIDYKQGERRIYRLARENEEAEYTYTTGGEGERWVRTGTFVLTSDLRSVLPSNELKKTNTD